MAYQIVHTKRFLSKVSKLTMYLEKEWGIRVATNFAKNLNEEIERLTKHPFVGSLQGRETVRSIIVSKHNRLYYRIEKDQIIISDIIDMRINPENHPYKSKAPIKEDEKNYNNWLLRPLFKLR